MRPEPPIFFLSEDNSMLDVHGNAEAAEQHLAGGHIRDGSFARELLVFDGLARPVDVRSAGDGVRLSVSYPTSDPWQVRARAVEAIRHRREWIAEQGDEITILGKTISKEEAEGLIANLTVGFDTSFAKFTQTLVGAFVPEIHEHRGSFLHNLFHG